MANRGSHASTRVGPLRGDQPAIATAVVTRRDCAHIPTAAFVRATADAAAPRRALQSEAPLEAVA